MILGYRSYENQSSLLTHTPTIQRQTKEEPKNNREPKRDRRSCSSSHCWTTRSSTFDGAPETGGWVAEKYAANPNPKNRTRTEQTNHHGPLICDVCEENFPSARRAFEWGKAFERERGSLIWVRKYLSGFGNLSGFSYFPFRYYMV